MNRAERRRAERDARKAGRRGPATQSKNRQHDLDLAEDALVLLFGISVKVLHDKYKWRSNKRLPEFAEALTDEYERFAEGEMTLDEYAEFVYQETGIRFKKRTG